MSAPTPSRDDPRRARSIRIAVMLGVVALIVYGGYILLVARSTGA